MNGAEKVAEIIQEVEIRDEVARSDHDLASGDEEEKKDERDHEAEALAEKLKRESKFKDEDKLVTEMLERF